jgi:hypothetical protein
MATKNIVPRTGSEGEIGTSSKPWNKGHINELTAVQLSSSYLSASADIRVAGDSHFGSDLTNIHIFTGSFHQTGSGATSTFKDQIITSGSMKVTGPAGTSEVFRAEGTGDFKVLTDGNVDLNAIGNDVSLEGSTITNKGATILGQSSSPATTTVHGNITASLGITASSFVGDGSGLTGVTGDWDGQHTGDAGITGSLELKTDSGLILQSTSSTTPSAATTTHNFLTVTDASGTTTSTFKYTNENPSGGAPPDLFQKTLNISASSGTDVLITAGNQSAPYGAGGNITLASALVTINGTDSVMLASGADISIDGATTTVNGNSLALNAVSDATVQCTAGNTDIKSAANASLSGSLTTIRAGSYAYMDTRYLLVQGQDASYDGNLYYASPSSYGISHFRYLSYGYDNTYNCAKFTAGYGGTGGDNQFIWYVSNDTSSEHPVMLLDFSGNLGIGTVTPTKTLDVVGNISASQEISASSFWGDGSGLTNVPVTETDTLATVTARGASTTTPVLFNTHITAASGINCGPLHVAGASVHSGTIDVYSGGGLYFFGNDGSQSGSLTNTPGGLLLTPDAAGRISVDGNAGITGSLEVLGQISASLGITAGSVTTDNVVSSGGFTIGSAVITEGEFERLDGASSTVAANKVVIADGSKNVATLGTVGCGAITSTGASSLESVDVSGSTTLGSLVTDTHIITGSTEIYTEAQTGLQVLQNVASSGYPLARFENTNAGGSTYIETHGVNQGGIKMYRGGTLRATIDTAGNAFTMYAGTPVPANLGFMIQSGKAEFKETTADNFTGTKGQVNISASSGPAIRIDSGATPQETTFKVEDYTTTMVSASADLLTMDDTNAPPTPSSAAHMYAKSGEMYVMDTAGNETQISPHGEDGEWQYFSRNTRTGKVVRIRMEKMIRKLEELTGETFIEEE